MPIKDEDKPWVSNYPPLQKWLDANADHCLWQVSRGRGANATSVEAWLVRARAADGSRGPQATIIIVEVQPKKMGWDIYTSGGLLDINKTLADVEARCGIVSP